MHPKKKFGKHSGMIQPIVNGLVFSVQLRMQIQIGKKEVKYFLLTIKPNEFMSFKQLGEVKDGVEDTESDKVEQWAGALENYTLKEVNGVTELLVEMDTNDDFKGFLMETFPKSLEQVKILSEIN